jgi:hypothetical protein
LHSGDPETGDGMNRFLASVFERKGSSTHFKDALDIRDWDEFEARWTTYLSDARAKAKEKAEASVDD